MRAKTIKWGAILSTLALLLVACIALPPVRGLIANAVDEIGRDFAVHYFNDDVNADDIANNNYNFGPDRYKQASEAVDKGDADSIANFIATNEGKGDFFESIAVDPALCAAIALDMDETLNFPDEDKILIDEQDVVIGQRADKAHLHFLKDHTYWERAVKLITERLTSGEIRIEKLTGYTSSMYQWPKHLEDNKPSVIVRNSTNSGGHFVQFDLGKPGIVKYRLECGYQPVDIKYWPTPDKPPVPDNPEPPEEPDPEPELEPKKDAGPQNTVPDDTPGKEDFGGGQNHNPDKTPTKEPQSPSSFNNTTTPSGNSGNAGGNGKPGNGKTSDGTPDASAGTQSGSRTVDNTNGTTENRGGSSYEVVGGNNQVSSDLNDVQSEHNSGTTEEPVKDDGVNQGDLDESDVE